MMINPRRITNAELYCQVEYATVCPFSARNRWLILQDGGGFYSLHTGDGDFVGMTLLGHNQEPRWDSANPDLLYFLTGNTLQSYNVVTHESTMVQIFDEYVMFAAGERNGVQGMGEGDIENNLWALAGMRSDGRRDVFLCDVKRQLKSKVLTLEPDQAHAFDCLYTTPSGNCQIGWYATGNGRFQGVELYDSDLQFIRQLAPTLAHNDVGRDVDGQEVLVRFNAADNPHLVNCPNGIERVDIATGKPKCLATFPWHYAGHVSVPDRTGWALVSVYAPNNEEPSRIYKVPLDGGQSTLLCETGSMMMRNAQGGMAYNPTPRAVSRDGSRVVFNSNSGILARGENYVDVYLLVLERQLEPLEPQPEPLKPAPPIVVAPPPANGGLALSLAEALKTAAALRVELTAEELESSQQHVRADEATFKLAEALGQIELLIAALAAVHPIDPTVWHRINFLSPVNQEWRRWGHMVLPSGLLQMNDVDDQKWSPISDETGDKYLLVRVEGGYEMYEATTNSES